MASGFGEIYNTSGQTSGSGRAVVCAVVSQSINESARTVTVTVRAMASYYRTSSSWSLSSGTAIYGSTVNTGYIKATVNGSTATSGSSIGIQAAKAFTASSGNTYTPADGYVTNRSGYVSEVSQSYTYSYGTDGAAISGTWSASMYLPGIGSTVSSLSGSFTTDSISASYVEPSGGTTSVVSRTWNTITLSASISSYGTPSDNSDRKLAVGVSDAASSLNVKRENQHSLVTSVSSTTITNSSIYPGATPITLTGMKAVYAYLWAYNGAVSQIFFNTTAYYLPPAPGTATYVYNAESQNFVVSYTGVASNNVTDYTASALTRTVRYRNSASGSWTYVIQDVVTALDTTTNVTVDPAEGETATVESWMTYQGQQSEVTTISVQGAGERPKLYGSANGEAQLITELYARDNTTARAGQRRRVYKLYASVDGVARPIYMRRGHSSDAGHDPYLLDVDFGDRIYLDTSVDPNVLHVYAASDITLDPLGYGSQYVDMILPVATPAGTKLQIESYSASDMMPVIGERAKGSIMGINMYDGFVYIVDPYLY